MTRRLPLGVGLALLAVAAALARTGTAVLPEGPVRILAFLTAGLAAAGLGLLDLTSRSAADPDAGTLPDPGERGGLRTPGDAVDERVADLGSDDRRGREALRERVGAVAVDVLARREGLAPGTARERIETGEWTDDGEAAALFDPARTSLGTRVRAFVAGDSPFARQFRRATAELARIDEPGGIAALDGRDQGSAGEEPAGGGAGSSGDGREPGNGRGPGHGRDPGDADPAAGSPASDRTARADGGDGGDGGDDADGPRLRADGGVDADEGGPRVRTDGGVDADGEDPRRLRADGGSDGEEGSSAVEHVRDRRTARWVGVAGAALIAAAAGTVARDPGLLLLGGFGAAVVAYARVAAPPAATLTLQRRFDPVAPEAGEPVTVTATITNVGDRTIPDLRLVDGVPDGMRVVDGSARLGAALRPGATATATYEVVGGHGTHVFESAEVALYDLAAVAGRRVRVHAEADAVGAERTAGEASLPVRARESQLTGQTPAPGGGDGVEFHGVREYRAGDPMRRVDWRRLARTGELTTITFRESRSERVVLVVDARRVAAVAPPGASETALDRAATAAASLVDGLLDAGHRVGLAALGPAECWIPPAGGREHGRRLAAALSEHEAFVAAGGAGADVDGLLARLPAAAHVVFLSPVTDDRSEEVARQLRAHGHAVSVVSPDPTATDTAGRRLARMERRSRLLALRNAEVAVFDWPPDRPVETLAARGRGSA